MQSTRKEFVCGGHWIFMPPLRGRGLLVTGGGGISTFILMHATCEEVQARADAESSARLRSESFKEQNVLTRLTLVLGVTAWASNCIAADSLSQFEAQTKIIRATAEDICSSVPNYSSSQQWSVSADGHAQLSGVVKKIVDVQGAASAAASGGRTEGVLQADLVKVLTEAVSKEKIKCKKAVFDELSNRLLGPLPTRPLSAAEKAQKHFDETNAEAVRLTAGVEVNVKSEKCKAVADHLAKMKSIFSQPADPNANWPRNFTTKEQEDSYLTLIDEAANARIFIATQILDLKVRSGCMA
jgi:hypothetical protein